MRNLSKLFLLCGVALLAVTTIRAFAGEGGGGGITDLGGIEKMTSNALLAFACVILYRGLEKTRAQKDAMSEQTVQFLTAQNTKLMECLGKFGDVLKEDIECRKAMTTAVTELNTILALRFRGEQRPYPKRTPHQTEQDGYPNPGPQGH